MHGVHTHLSHLINMMLFWGHCISTLASSSCIAPLPRHLTRSRAVDPSPNVLQHHTHALTMFTVHGRNATIRTEQKRKNSWKFPRFASISSSSLFASSFKWSTERERRAKEIFEIAAQQLAAGIRDDIVEIFPCSRISLNSSLRSRQIAFDLHCERRKVKDRAK